MERRTFIQSFPIVCRICVPEPDTNEYLLAAGLEELSGLAAEVPERARWLRTLTLEMARLAATLMVLGGQVGSMGLGPVPQWTMTLRDFILDSFEELSGHRIYHMYIVYGGVRREPAGGVRGQAREEPRGHRGEAAVDRPADVRLRRLQEASHRRGHRPEGVGRRDGDHGSTAQGDGRGA